MKKLEVPSKPSDSELFSTSWKKKTDFDANILFSELKKDPGIPRLPDLKMKLRNRQNKPTVRVTLTNYNFYAGSTCFRCHWIA